MTMAFFLIILLALHLCQASAKLDGSNSHYDFNAIQDKYADLSLSPANELSTETEDVSDDKPNNNFNADAVALSAVIDNNNIPFIHAIDGDKTELQFRQPIEWLNVNQLRNAIILKFHSPNANYLNSLDPEELNRLRILHENAIRLGKRAFDSSLSGFSSSSPLASDKNAGMGVERNHQVVRDSRGDSFMRFGRSINGESSGGGGNDFMRFGRSGGNNDFMRFGRGQDFMRFGRSPGQDFLRFGRSPGQDFLRFGKSAGQDFLRFGRSPEQDFMRFGRWPGQDFMRFGRSAGQDFLRFGRSQGQDFMRFGRSPTQDFMRFGKSPAQDFMRFGKSPAQDFMRFGRSPGHDFMRLDRTPSQDFMRFGRSSLKNTADNNLPRYSRPDNFMRFGRTPPQSSDFMRFGKSPEKGENLTNSAESQMAKNELKQAVKLIHEADKSADSGDNPVDKAIKVLFDKHQDQNQMQDEPNSMQHEDSNDTNMENEYFLKNLK